MRSLDHLLWLAQVARDEQVAVWYLGHGGIILLVIVVGNITAPALGYDPRLAEL